MDIEKMEQPTSSGEAEIGTFRLPQEYEEYNKVQIRDRKYRDLRHQYAPFRYKFTKDTVAKFLKDPYHNEKGLRDAMIYLYCASSHFRRLIQYFVSLTDFAYVVSPTRIDTKTANRKTVERNYRRVLNLLANMDIKNSFEKILTVCFREDLFFGTIRESSESVIIQQLPSDWCSISVIEDNVLNVTFDFSYFTSREQMLQYYPDEFREKYERYRSNRYGKNLRYQELDSPNSFAIKCNKDILPFGIPPFAGLLRELYDLEDYKNLKLTKTKLENYALLDMRIPLDSEGNYGIDFEKAKKFWQNLDAVLPEEVGSVLTPMDLNKISFERTHTGDTDTIAEAENNLFTEAGVSSLLFNNPKASSSALLLSIKVDQQMTYGLICSIEAMLNRFIRHHNYGKYFKATFLDISVFNRKEQSEQYVKAIQYGFPMISMYCAAQGLTPDEVDSMNMLEVDVLNLVDRFKPLVSSNTMSGKAVSASTGEGAGRPRLDDDELTESGMSSRDYE